MACHIQSIFIGKGVKKAMREHDKAWEANMKATYDQTMAHQANINSITAQALQNAVTTANLVNNQAVGHRDIAVDRQWNIDEVAQLVAKTSVQLDAIASAIVADVLDRLAYMTGLSQDKT